MQSILRFLRDTRGATAIEYSLIGVVVSIALIGGARVMGVNMNSLFYGKLADGFS
jgi:pilus assembly protein Flp/PilA